MRAAQEAGCDEGFVKRRQIMILRLFQALNYLRLLTRTDWAHYLPWLRSGELVCFNHLVDDNMPTHTHTHCTGLMIDHQHVSFKRLRSQLYQSQMWLRLKGLWVERWTERVNSSQTPPCEINSTSWNVFLWIYHTAIYPEEVSVRGVQGWHGSSYISG